MQPSSFQPRLIHLFLAIAVLLNFSGLFVPVMALDAARYASIAKTMVLNNNYLELFCDRTDWLDKPHFPFWVTAFFFKVFGISTWAYKLPGILFTMMGAWYTFLFGKKLYNNTVGLWAALILLTAQHIVISNNDVRAEPFMTGLIIASVYHFYLAYTANKFSHLLLASLFAACAVMTKGIFALIPISGAIAGNLLIKKDWRNLFHLRWLVAAVLIFIFIIPELYALWYQFDMHPEKLVFGERNVSGIRFFFWDSQFGRFFNTGPIKGEGEPTFFIHTTLWAFLPWSLLLFASIFVFIRKNRRHPKTVEWMSLCGSMITFLLFSASSFQLPHYLNIVFPFFAILTAQYLWKAEGTSTVNRIKITQTVLTVLLLVLIAGVSILFRPAIAPPAAITLIALVVLLLVFFRKVFPVAVKERILFQSVLAAVAVNLFLNLVFYPSLMKYQSGSEAAFWLNQNNSQKLPVATPEPSYPLEFYLNQHVHLLSQPHDQPLKPYLIFAPKDFVEKLKGPAEIKVLKEFDEFSITMLDMQFVNHATRDQAVKKMVVARISP